MIGVAVFPTLALHAAGVILARKGMYITILVYAISYDTKRLGACRNVKMYILDGKWQDMSDVVNVLQNGARRQARKGIYIYIYI